MVLGVPEPRAVALFWQRGPGGAFLDWIHTTLSHHRYAQAPLQRGDTSAPPLPNGKGHAGASAVFCKLASHRKSRRGCPGPPRKAKGRASAQQRAPPRDLYKLASHRKSRPGNPFPRGRRALGAGRQVCDPQTNAGYVHAVSIKV